MADILFKCPECGEQLAVGVEDMGLDGNCPECDKPIQIPNASFEIQCLERRWASLKASAITIGGTVQQVTRDGLLLGDKLITNHPRQGQAVEGEHLRFRAWRDGQYTYDTVGNYSRTIAKWRYCCPDQGEEGTTTRQERNVRCPLCGGTGKIVNFKGSPGSPCTNCGGTGQVKQ